MPSMNAKESGEFLRHDPCETCGSSDGKAVYTDHTFCFVCSTHSQGDTPSLPQKSRAGVTFLEGTIESLPARQISQDTCAKFGYSKTTFQGKPAQVAPYYDAEGNLVAQKVRTPGKGFSVVGDIREALPFGSHAFPKTGKMIVVTEGEIDALSMSQAQGNKWPVVSIPNGAQGAKKHIAKHLDYYRGFEEVVLMFDMDEPGRAAAVEAARIIGSRAKIAELPLKDPNEMLQAGRVAELVNAMWRARPYKPEGIVDLASLKDQILTPPAVGLSFPWPKLTELSCGIPERAIVTVGGAGGGGKTDFLTQIMQHLVTAHRQPIGVFSLEQHVSETGRRIAGKFAEKTFHVPDAGWTTEDIERAFEQVSTRSKVFLYDSFGVNEWDAIKDKIEFLRHTEGVRYFFVDNLTALAAAEEDEKTGLERIMADAGSLVQKLDVTLFFVSHLSTPEGKPHEEGGRVMGKHFKGSRTIIFWSFLMIGLERDQQAEDPVVRATTTVRVLKERKTGRGVGEVMHLFYNRETGMLIEADAPIACGFQDETTGGGKSPF